MAKEKSTDKEELKRAKHSKKEKRSEKDGVHKSKKVKPEKIKTTVTDDPEITTKLLDALTEEKPSNIAKEENGSSVTVKVKPAPLLGALVPFAHPLADEKVQKKVFKSIKKAAKNKSLKRGVKEVVKALRKSPTGATATSVGSGGADPPLPHGIVVLAADISPMDVISHIPVLCEDHAVPYVFVPSRVELGAAGNTKRPTSVVLVGMQASGGKKRKRKDKGGESGEKEGEEGGKQQEEEKDFGDVYKELVKVVLKASRDVRI